ncbi:MAG: sarcosine oxidase subunit gamma [Yoonia sp.]
MVKLLETTPCAGLLPRQIGQVKLSEVSIGKVWSVSPFAGKLAATDAALRKLGVAFPMAGQIVSAGPVTAMWFGHGQALVLGAEALPKLPAAVTDQSDGWACVRIEGHAVDVLARLAPVDLRGAAGARRTLVGHMSAVIIARDGGAFDVMVMRSMAATLVHELEVAATGVSARG